MFTFHFIGSLYASLYCCRSPSGAAPALPGDSTHQVTAVPMEVCLSTKMELLYEVVGENVKETFKIYNIILLRAKSKFYLWCVYV